MKIQLNDNTSLIFDEYKKSYSIIQSNQEAQFDKILLVKAVDEETYEAVPVIVDSYGETLLIPKTFQRIPFPATIEHDEESRVKAKIWLLLKATSDIPINKTKALMIEKYCEVEKVIINMDTVKHRIRLSKIINDRVYVICDYNYEKLKTTEIIIDKANIVRNIISVTENNDKKSYLYRASINNKRTKVRVAI